MRYWLTTHYPHYVADEAEWWIYVRRGDEHLVGDFNAGDRVAFYEVKKGPDRVGNGKRPNGVKGIRCLGTGTGPPQSATFQEQYVDGQASDFTLECRCAGHDFSHCLPVEEMFSALERRLNLRGLGGGAGFVELSPDEFFRLESAFLATLPD